MGCSASAPDKPIAASFYELQSTTIDGEPYSFEQLRGKVVMITNVASY